MVDFFKKIFGKKENKELEKESITLPDGGEMTFRFSLTPQAMGYYDQGRLKEAMELLKEEEKHCREEGDKRELARTLGVQARILGDWDRFEEAIELLIEEEKICNELNDKEGEARSLFNQSLLICEKGHEKCLPMLNKALEVARESGSREIIDHISNVIEGL